MDSSTTINNTNNSHIDSAPHAADPTPQDSVVERRRAELQMKRKQVLEDCEKLLTAALTDIRDTASKVLATVESHVDVTHNVLCEYEGILEQQKDEMHRLESVSQQVHSAMNHPFLMGRDSMNGGGGSVSASS